MSSWAPLGIACGRLAPSRGRRGRGLARALVLALLCGAALAGPVRAEGEGGTRVALVIGNGAYQSVSALPNPANDAVLLAEALRGLGFTVFETIDADLARMRDALGQFGRAASRADAALFFFAGHGVQVHGRNFLLPTTARISDRSDLYREALQLDLVMTELAMAAPGVAVVVLDACRDDPFPPLPGGATRSMGEMQGLAAVRGSAGTLIAYATAPGAVALDGADANSPFTAALASWIDEPGLEIGPLMRRVRQDVIAATDGQQVPWVEEALVGEFFFKPAPRHEVQLAEALPRPFDLPDAEAIFWRTIETLDAEAQQRAALRLYGEVFPDGRFGEEAELLLAALDAADATGEPVPQLITDLSVVAPPRPGAFTDLLLWESASAGAAAADFAFYLDAQPTGLFADLAADRLREAAAAGNGDGAAWIEMAALEVPYGLDGMPLQLDRQARGVAAAATLTELPAHGTVRLAAEALAPGERLAAQDLAEIVYVPEPGVTGPVGRAAIEVASADGSVTGYAREVRVQFDGKLARDLVVPAGIGPVPFAIALPGLVAAAGDRRGGEVRIEALPVGVRAFTAEAEPGPGSRVPAGSTLELALALPAAASGGQGELVLAYDALDQAAGDGAVREVVEAITVRAASASVPAQQQVDGIIGVGPQLLALELPADGATPVLVEAVPFAALRLADGAPLEVGDYLPAASLDGLTFEGYRHVEGPVGRLVLSHLGENGERLVRGVDLAVAVHDCDLLAADPLDPERVGDGTWLFRFRGDGRETYLDAPATLLACLQASADFPDVPRFKTQLARAYIGVEDYAEARFWLEPAAAAGYPPALSGLALLYSRGWGVAQDHERAFAYWQDAADAGHVASQHEVGLAYWEGRGVERDLVRAAYWIGLAADYGFHWGQHNLARLYKDGLGVPQDEARAVALWEASAAQDNGWAKLELGRMLLAGRGVEPDVERAVALLEAAGEAEIDWADVELARLYARGERVPQDFGRAEAALERAIASGSTVARLERARLELQVEPAKRDTDRALAWLREAGEAGSVPAWFELGVVLDEGRVTGRDPAGAAEAFAAAAEAGHAGAATRLAHLLRRGDGVAADPARARQLYGQAAALGNGWAAVELAGMQLRGEGGPADPDAGIGRLATVAVTAGDAALAARAERDLAALPQDELVLRVQSWLAARGYDTGVPDGQMGPRTAAAIRAFEAAAGLPATGRIGPGLVAALAGG